MRKFSDGNLDQIRLDSFVVDDVQERLIVRHRRRIDNGPYPIKILKCNVAAVEPNLGTFQQVSSVVFNL